MISTNATPACLACGSKAVLSLSRLLGGSLRSQPLARVIRDDELNRIVRDLLFTIPGTEIMPSQVAMEADGETECELSMPVRRQSYENFPAPKFEFEPAIGVITERAQALTGATGAAIALRSGDEIVCRARAGGPRLMSGFACKQIPEFQQSACEAGKWCSATMLKTIRRWIWQVAGDWACAQSSPPRCGDIKGPLAFSRCFPPRRTHFTINT
ncbi:MAG TPA: hypothetical protein VFA90_01705 [Terriglobales bacterium]|nr:hypothetical protein [Terriglobales bacterium]